MMTRSFLFLLPTLALAVACGGSTADSGTTSGGPQAGADSGASAPPGAPGNVGSSSSGGNVSQPETWLPKADGCGDFLVYAKTESGRKYFVIEADRKKLGLEKIGDTADVDLEHDTTGTKVHIDYYGKAPTEAPYCTDIQPPVPTHTMDGVSGHVVFTLKSDPNSASGYAVDVRWVDLFVMQSADGGEEPAPKGPFTDVHVGWSAG